MSAPRNATGAEPVGVIHSRCWPEAGRFECGPVPYRSTVDRIDDAWALLIAADRFDLVWINGFVRMDNARRDYQTMLMVRGGRVQIDQILPTLPIAGHVLAFGNGSFKVFKAGIANPIDIGNPLTRDDLELAYTKVTGAKRRFALADAYRDYGSGYGGMVVRQAMRALGYL